MIPEPPDEHTRLREILVTRLMKRGNIRTRRVMDAMLSVPRHLFVTGILQEDAYDDRPLPIHGGQTISAPHMVAEMCEAAGLGPGMRVLEIGSGSGYHSAVISRLVDPGHVFTTEVVPVLATSARRNLVEAGITNVTVLESDGSMGLKEQSPYDRIMVTCASPGIPDPLVKQLKPGGMLIIPVGDRMLQTLTVVTKDARGKITREQRMGCVFVPMLGRYGFR